MTTKNSGLMACFLGVLALPAGADVLGGTASVSFWPAETSGDLQKDNTSVDAEDDLGLDDREGFVILSAAVEHPVPMLPNLRARYFALDQDGSGTLPGVFGALPAGEVQTHLDLSHLDLTLYYEVLDNWLNLDAGLTAKIMQGELEIENSLGSQDQTDIDEVIPMVYLDGQFELPFSGWSVGATGNGIAYSGDKAYDLAGWVGYQWMMLEGRAGYRELRVDVEGINNLDVDGEINGPFVELGVNF